MFMEVLVDAAESLMYVIFINQFHDHKLAGPSQYCSTLAAAGLLFINILLSDYITFFHWSTILIDCIIIFGYAHFFLKGTLWSYIISVVLFDVGLVGSVVVSMGISTLFYADGIEAWLVTGTKERAVLLILNKVILGGYIYAVLKIKMFLGSNRNRITYGIILINPVLMIAMASLIIHMLLQAYKAEGNVDLYVLLLVGVVALVAVTFYLAGYSLKKEAEAADIRMRNEILDAQKQALKNTIEGYDKLRKVEHDMKNHLLGIRYYLEKEDIAGGLEYLERLISQLTGNMKYRFPYPESDSLWEAIIGIKTVDAATEGIHVTQKIFPGRYEEIDTMDLCIILGNLLDNAIEAEIRNTSEKILDIEMREEHRIIYIQIKNWIDSDRIAEVKKLISNKPEPLFHGLGLRNTEAAVRKYGGKMKNEMMENYFVVRVVLPLDPI